MGISEMSAKLMPLEPPLVEPPPVLVPVLPDEEPPLVDPPLVDPPPVEEPLPLTEVLEPLEEDPLLHPALPPEEFTAGLLLFELLCAGSGPLAASNFP